MSKPFNSAAVRFGVFQVNLSARELRKHGVKTRIAGQPFFILALLLEKPGEIVTREALRQKLWPTDTFVDFEHGLNKAVNRLRQALGDSAEKPLYIETLPRVGYRFIAPVEALAPGAPALARVAGEPSFLSAESDAPASRLAPGRAAFSSVLSFRFLGRPIYAIFAAVAVLGAAGLFYFWRSAPLRHTVQSGRVVLAVLPFENLSGDPQQEYFSDGLTEEMIAQLGRLDPEHVGVIARTSVMHYKHSQEQLERIGRELGVQYVLEGSVRRDANKVRISAQLIQVRDQTHLWGRQYDRELSSLLALQGEIAQEIADEIQLTLGEHKRIAPAHQVSLSPKAYEAYDLYLKGRYFWNKRTPQGLQRALQYFEQATAKEPTYARAYAGLADSYALMSGYSLAPPKEFMPGTRAAAVRALEIDERLAEAHTSLAIIAQNYDWDWQTAEKEYRRAIQLEPNYATAHHWYAEYLSFQGRFDEAFAEMDRARQLDPLSLIIATDNGEIFYLSRQYDRAIQQFRAVLDIEPGFPRAHFFLVFAYVQKGLFADALADIEKWRGTDETPWSLTMLAYVYGRSGQTIRAQRVLEKLHQWNRHRAIDPAPILCAYIGMENKEEAFAWFEKAYLEHSTALTSLKVNPIYDPLRSDPRFQEILRRIGLPQ